MAKDPADYESLETALETVRTRTSPVRRTETVPVERASGRVLAEPVTAPRSVPHYRRAAMDGFAVMSADISGASPEDPVRLRRASGALTPGTAVPIDTGEVVPDGADAVVRVERTEPNSAAIDVLEPVTAGTDIAPVGEDVTAGQQLFPTNHRLTPPDLGVLASTGIETLLVRTLPRIYIQPTGDELVAADPAPGEVIDTNSLVADRYVTKWGGIADRQAVIDDDSSALRSAIQRGLNADLVVTLGGSSVGDRDLVPAVVEDLGEILVDGIAIRPGHPVSIGQVDGTLVLILPGYPVSATLTAILLLRPAIHWLSGTSPPTYPSEELPLETAIESRRGWRRFERVRVREETGTRVAVPVRQSGAGALTSVTEADGWVTISEEITEIPAGKTVTVEDWTVDVRSPDTT